MVHFSPADINLRGKGRNGLYQSFQGKWLLLVREQFQPEPGDEESIYGKGGTCGVCLEQCVRTLGPWREQSRLRTWWRPEALFGRGKHVISKVLRLGYGDVTSLVNFGSLHIPSTPFPLSFWGAPLCSWLSLCCRLSCSAQLHWDKDSGMWPCGREGSWGVVVTMLLPPGPPFEKLGLSTSSRACRPPAQAPSRPMGCVSP